MTLEGIDTLRRLTPVDDLERLETELSDLADFEIPPCDLVNANLILPFLPPDHYAAVWDRIHAAIPVGGRFAGMLFGDRDDAAGDPEATCPPADVIRGYFDGFDIEYWTEKEEDGETALGDAHHFHLVEVVAVRREAPAEDPVG